MTSNRIVIVDYGRGNLRSVAKALAHCGATVVVSADPAVIARAEKLVVPGVGAFGDCMASIDRLALRAPIVAHIREGKRFLGICLGLQLLFEESEESPDGRGLGVFEGNVVRFKPVHAEEKVPHMGWNTLQLRQPTHPMFAGIEAGSAAYFVHSYYVCPRDATLVAATSDYITPFCAAIATDTLFACQFHPEKSQPLGLRLLQNFVNWQ